MNSKEFTDLEAVQKEIVGLLESGSLFRRLDYPLALHNFNASTSKYFYLPKLLSRECDVCRIQTAWECGSPAFSVSDLFVIKTYKCRNCETKFVNFAIAWWITKTMVHFEKFGEYPKPEVEMGRLLEEKLGHENSSLYRRALISANISHGLAAVAYARRVVENKVDALLDLIAASVRLSAPDDINLSKIEEVKASHQVDRKIELASTMLPPHLRPGGHNPLSALYTNLSDALHNKSEKECLEVFDDFRFIFEHLFKSLSIENEEASAFARRFTAKVSGQG